MSSSLRAWIEDVPWMMQGVLFTALRGCDGMSKEDPSKKVARAFRSVILKSANEVGSFLAMIPTEPELREAMTAVLCDYDKYPMHFLMHLLHAAEIIGYKHPDRHTRLLWREFYFNGCDHLHMRCET